jgi:AhpC/TSA family
MAFRATAVLFYLMTTAVWAAPPLGTNLNGQPVEQIAPAGTSAVVLFFAASDCPISNRYIPEIERQEREFAADGVRFWWVYPNPEDTAAVIRSHDEQFDIHAETVLDTNQRLTRLAHATMTPEVAVFVPASAGLHEVYRGRIDNRYIALGQEHPWATRHDLEAAIRAVLAHQPVPGPGGPDVGCSIVPLNMP